MTDERAGERLGAQGHEAGAARGGGALLVVGEQAQGAAGVRGHHEQRAAADQELARRDVHPVEVLGQLRQLVVLHPGVFLRVSIEQQHCPQNWSESYLWISIF